MAKDLLTLLTLIEPAPEYDPRTIEIVANAFNRVCWRLSPSVRDVDEVRQKLTVALTQHVEEGERDPLRLAELAMQDLRGLA